MGSTELPPPELNASVVGLNRFAVVVRGRSHRCAFSNLPAIIFSSIFPLTLSLSAVIASVNQFHSKEAFMGILRDRMIEEMKLRNFSLATQKSYLSP
jgi:hypothetical protein